LNSDDANLLGRDWREKRRRSAKYNQHSSWQLRAILDRLSEGGLLVDARFAPKAPGPSNPRYSYADHIGRLPFRNARDADKFTEGLRKAGLAE
jgi:hypothetical protein